MHMENSIYGEVKRIETGNALALLTTRTPSPPPCEKPKTPGQIDEVLMERGFPARHRQRLRRGEMHGPALEKAQAFLPRILRGDALLIVVGKRGPGKTQMATWWAAERIKAGKFAGHYRKTMDVLSEIKATWGDGGRSLWSESDVLRKYRKTEYLVLDEFHERGSSEWEARTLINIIDHRYDNLLTTVLIANMDKATAFKEINPSILSRAKETGGLIVCDWPTYRAKGEAA